MTKYTGTPVYPPIDWDSVGGIVLPLSTLVASVILFFFMYFMNNKKLKSNGYIRIVDILKGNERAKVLEAHMQVRR